MTTQKLVPSVCPHDCPSACALDVELDEQGRVGRIRGAQQPYTAGVICAKVSRYAETVYSPHRIQEPLLRDGSKGEGKFRPVSWDQALDIIADRFKDIAQAHGKEAIWPYFYAGTLGRVQQTSTNRLRNALGYSRQVDSICSQIAGAGWAAGIGKMSGVDPREMAESDLIVAWGSNFVNTQVGAMHWVNRARTERGAKFVVVDPYRNATAARADLHLALRPGTDAALACAMMNVMLAEGLADREYISQYSDFSPEVEAHLVTRTPAWAAPITGLSEDEIIAFARLYGSTPRAFIRLGYGFTRQRNGAVALHAVTCLPALSGAWRHPGGGAAASAWKNFQFLKDGALEGSEKLVRVIDMCRIGPALNGDPDDLQGGPPVMALFVQNTNPALVAPDSLSVRKGLAREDLFTVVHEQRMTETARYADIVLPATTMLEHDDVYVSYGHTFLQTARAVIPPVGQSRSNHWVTSELAKRLGVSHPAFGRPEWELVDELLTKAGLGSADEVHAKRWVDCARPFAQMHFLEGFPNPSGKFRFFADWAGQGSHHAHLPRLPDHLAVTDEVSGDKKYRLVTAPSRSFLNSSFNLTAGSLREAGRPTALLHPDHCAALGLAEGDQVVIGNERAEVTVWLAPSDAIRSGVVVVEGLWPSEAFPGGIGINALVGADKVAPAGGAAFHDTAVWLRKV